MKRFGFLVLLMLSGTLDGPARCFAAESPDVASLIRDLDAGRFVVRERAEDSLRKMGLDIVPELQKALQNNPSPETQDRLNRIIKQLTRLPWHVKLEEASAEARKSGKPILVFSTIGDPDGFA
jgi:hypothetical protein